MTVDVKRASVGNHITRTAGKPHPPPVCPPFLDLQLKRFLIIDSHALAVLIHVTGERGVGVA